jgi:hypothetical protein
MAFALTSPEFDTGQSIPAQFTADGADVSPQLEWTAPPGGTKSLVLIVDDPDAPAGTWVHWVLAGIPPDRKSLPSSVGADPHPGGLVPAVNGRNTFGSLGYGGPAPPRGPAHRYFFKLYALDAEPAWKPGVTKADAEKAMKGHVLGQAQLMGTYQRK